MRDIAPIENSSSTLPVDIVLGDYKTDPVELAMSLKPTGERWKGSNPGGIYQREIDGQKEQWYVKFCDSKEPSYIEGDHLRTEFVASRIYHRLGFNVPEAHLINLGGKLALAKRGIPDLDDIPNIEQLAKLDEVKKGFLADVYLNNWDVTYNFGISHGVAYRTDSGGALNRRAKGEFKKFGELKEEAAGNFRDKNINSRGSFIYAGVQPSDLEEAAKLVANLKNEEIAAIVASAGYKDKVEEIKLTSVLIRRREDVKKIYGINKIEKPQEISPAEEENWQKLEGLLPKDEGLERLLREVDEFKENTLIPLINSDLQKIKDGLTSLGLTLEEEPISEEVYKEKMGTVLALEKEIDMIQEQLRLGNLPQIPNEAGRSPIENLRLKFSKNFKDRKIREIQTYCRQKRKEISEIVNGEFAELQNPVEYELEKISNEIIVPLGLENSNGRLIANIPEKVLKTTQDLKELILTWKEWKKYCEEMGSERIDKESFGKMEETGERISKNVNKLSEIWNDQVVKAEQTTILYKQKINERLTTDKKYGYLSYSRIITKFLHVPSQSQENQINGFYKIASDYLEKYRLGDTNENKYLFNPENNTMVTLKRDFRKKCEEIRIDRVSHLTLTNTEYIKDILVDGFLISSKGQMHLEHKVRTNSPASKKEFLPDVSFAVNGAELQYGGVSENLKSKTNGIVDVVSTEISNIRDRVNIVGFVFPYTSVLKGHQFMESLSTQGSSELHYNELHVFHPNFDEDNSANPEYSVTKVDINDGVFIVPESQKEYWTQFLLKPKSEGGPGHDVNWVNEHLRAYPNYTNPRDFVELTDAFGGLDFPKAEQGILIPTGKSSEFSPLFKWVTL